MGHFHPLEIYITALTELNCAINPNCYYCLRLRKHVVVNVQDLQSCQSSDAETTRNGYYKANQWSKMAILMIEYWISSKIWVDISGLVDHSFYHHYVSLFGVQNIYITKIPLNRIIRVVILVPISGHVSIPVISSIVFLNLQSYASYFFWGRIKLNKNKVVWDLFLE